MELISLFVSHSIIWMDGWLGGWVDGWIDGWEGGWLDGRMDDWMDGQTDRYVMMLSAAQTTAIKQ